MPNLGKVLATLIKEQTRLQNRLQNVETAVSALRGIGRNVGTRAEAISRSPRRLSVAARKRIAAAQRARWAKYRAQKKAA